MCSCESEGGKDRITDKSHWCMMMRTLEGRWEIEGISVCDRHCGARSPDVVFQGCKLVTIPTDRPRDVGHCLLKTKFTNVSGSLISACRSWLTFEHLQYNKQTLEVASNMICEREEGEGEFCYHTYMLYRRGCIFSSKVVTAPFVRVDGKAERNAD